MTLLSENVERKPHSSQLTCFGKEVSPLPNQPFRAVFCWLTRDMFHISCEMRDFWLAGHAEYNGVVFCKGGRCCRMPEVLQSATVVALCTVPVPIFHSSLRKNLTRGSFSGRAREVWQNAKFAKCKTSRGLCRTPGVRGDLSPGARRPSQIARPLHSATVWQNARPPSPGRWTSRGNPLRARGSLAKCKGQNVTPLGLPQWKRAGIYSVREGFAFCKCGKMHDSQNARLLGREIHFRACP